MTGQILLIVLITFIFGLITAWLLFSIELKRLLNYLSLEQTQERLSNSASSFKTFVPALRKLVSFMLKQEQHFIDSIAAAGAETEALTERYQLLAENIAAAIVIRDQAGKIQYCSKFTEVLTGYALSEIYQCSDDFFLQISHQDDRESFRRALSICSYGEAFLLRFRFLHKAGFELWAEMRTVPLLNSDGTVSSSLSIILDVTAAVRYQRQIEEKNRDLHEFGYMLTHDLKAPILTIKGMLNIIDQDHTGELSSDLQELLRHIADSIKRLEKLVAGVLEYTKINNEEAVEEAVDLNEVLREVINDFQVIVKKEQIAISCAELPAISSDRAKIYRIFSNLIGNAIKYRATDRAAQISVKPLETPSPHLISIAVIDTGLGIPAGKLNDIFRPFQRAHGNAVAGLGIGLASVKKLLDKLGGEIKVESTEGQGSIFTVSFRNQCRELGTGTGSR